MKENKLKKDYFFYLGILGICLFLIMLFIYAIHFSSLTPEWLQYYFSNASNDPADWGTFGDFLGGTLNPIFGLLGFLVLIRTLSLQRQQLDDQRQAMQQQQEDIQAQRESLAISNKTQIKQQFEGTFFQLLQQLQAESDYLIKQDNSNDIYSILKSGFKLAKKACDDLEYKNWHENNDQNQFKHIDIKSEVDNIINGKIYSLARYFSIVELIIKFIDNLNYPNLPAMSQKDKNFYVDLLITNLNTDAFTLLSLSSRDHPEVVETLTNLGCLRASRFSPKAMPNHPVAQLLKESYGEQAFRPIEVPPVNN